MRLNGIVGAEIPYYKMMNKAMPGPAKDTKRKPKNGRLTEIDPKTNKPRLKSGVPISRAVEVLYMFENTDVLPYQIEEMKVTISAIPAEEADKLAAMTDKAKIFLYLNDKIKEALNELSDFEGMFKEEIKEDEEGND